MLRTLKELAKIVNGEVVGDPNLAITGFSGIKEAVAGELAFLANSKYASLVESTKASAIIVPKDFSAAGKNLILCDNPSLAFAQILGSVVEGVKPTLKGVHKTAVIDEGVVLGKDVTVGPHTVVERGAKIGEGTIIYSGCFIGQKTVLGTGCLIYPNVVIRERISVGNRAIIHSGTVIGSDGFGFVNVKGSYVKIPQIGSVEIGDDVEIGANVTIDRARFEKTIIGSGTKIDNLVQIAHNVKIGKNCIIVSQVGISGSSTLENNVTLAGQVGIAGHLTIGENAIVASKSGVPGSLPGNAMYWGTPAKPHMQAKRVNACLQNLPEHVKTIQELKKRVAELEAKVTQHEQK